MALWVSLALHGPGCGVNDERDAVSQFIISHGNSAISGVCDLGDRPSSRISQYAKEIPPGSQIPPAKGLERLMERVE